MLKRFEEYFRFRELGTDLETEIRAGVVTFMTMAYIIFVNPIILANAGIPFESVLIATCVATGITTIMMGLISKYPIAAAPGMGMNSFFVSVVIGYGLSYQIVLGMVFWEGIIFLALTLLGVWDRVVQAIPQSLKFASAAGIGAFIFYLGLRDAGIVTIDTKFAIPAPGDFADPMTIISIVGIVITCALMLRKTKGALLIGILVTGVLTTLAGKVAMERPAALEYEAFMSLKIFDSINVFAHPELIGAIFVLLFFDMFDTVGTMIGVGEQAGFMKNGHLPRSRKVLGVDAAGTVIGAIFGTSTVTSYIESAAGVSEGGRTGLTSVVTGLLFFVSLAIALAFIHYGPGIVSNAPGTLSHMTAPALIIVGTMMMSKVAKIEWEKFDEALPAALVILIMPMCYRISMGLSAGFISWPIMKLVKGEGKKVDPILYALAGILIAGFVLLEALRPGGAQ